MLSRDKKKGNHLPKPACPAMTTKSFAFKINQFTIILKFYTYILPEQPNDSQPHLICCLMRPPLMTVL